MPRVTVLRIYSVELLPFKTLHVHGTYTHVIHISCAKSVIISQWIPLEPFVRKVDIDIFPRRNLSPALEGVDTLL